MTLDYSGGLKAITGSFKVETADRVCHKDSAVSPQELSDCVLNFTFQLRVYVQYYFVLVASAQHSGQSVIYLKCSA